MSNYWHGLARMCRAQCYIQQSSTQFGLALHTAGIGTELKFTVTALTTGDGAATSKSMQCMVPPADFVVVASDLMSSSPSSWSVDVGDVMDS